MSIKDENGNEIVTLNTIHAMAFRVLIWIGIVATPGAFVIFWQQNTTLQIHEWRISALENIGSIRHGGVSQNVNVGSADAVAEEDSAKTWLTTQEVAKRENVTDRTVINYIESGMIEPSPERIGKSWHIAENYRIIPKDSETCGNNE